MNRTNSVLDYQQTYGRDIRIAAVLALGLVVAAFRFAKIPEPAPYVLRDGASLSVIVPLDPSRIVDIPQPPRHLVRPKLPVPAPDGKPTDDGVGQHDFSTLPRHDVTATGELDWVPFHCVSKRPVLAHGPAPDYPELARLAQIEGRVVVEVGIDTLGAVVATRVLKSSGAQVLDDAAVGAVLEWRFTPAYQRDRPVAVKVAVPVSFRLD